MAKRKGKFGKFVPRRTNNKDMSKIQCFGCQEYGHYKRNCPKLKKDTNNKRKREEAHITQEMKEEGNRKKKEDPLDLYYCYVKLFTSRLLSKFLVEYRSM